MSVLEVAADNGNVEAVKLLLQTKARVGGYGVRLGRAFSPLHRAAANGHRAVVDLLLKAKADPVSCLRHIIDVFVL